MARLDVIRERAGNELKVTDEQLRTWHSGVLLPFADKRAIAAKCPWNAEIIEARMDALNLPFFVVDGHWAVVAKTYADLFEYESARAEVGYDV